MNFFEIIGEKVVNIVRKIFMRDKSTAKLAGTGSQLSNEEQKINNLLFEIGRIYFEKYASCPDDEFIPLIANIEQLHRIKRDKINKQKIRNKCIGMVSCAVCVIIAFVLTVGIISSVTETNDPKKIAEKYIIASIEGNYEVAFKYSVISMDEQLAIMEKQLKGIYMGLGFDEDGYIRYLKEHFGAESIREHLLQNIYSESNYIREIYGSNYKPTVKIDFINKYIKNEINEFMYAKKEEINHQYIGYLGTVTVIEIIDLNDITEIIEYNAKINISGSKKNGDGNIKIILAKISGKWRVLTGERFEFMFL